jgi:hypothetical protein
MVLCHRIVPYLDVYLIARKLVPDRHALGISRCGQGQMGTFGSETAVMGTYQRTLGMGCGYLHLAARRDLWICSLFGVYS